MYSSSNSGQGIKLDSRQWSGQFNGMQSSFEWPMLPDAAVLMSKWEYMYFSIALGKYNLGDFSADLYGDTR